MSLLQSRKWNLWENIDFSENFWLKTKGVNFSGNELRET